MDGITLFPEAVRSENRAHVVIAGMPPEAHAAMPVQRLDRFDAKTRRRLEDPRSHSDEMRRIGLLLGMTGLCFYALYEMYHVLAVGDMTPLEWVFLILFGFTFAWISLAFVASLPGFLLARRAAFQPFSSGRRLEGRTAVLMPIYNEDPARVFAALEAMAESVSALGEAGVFDWFVLSDSTDPEAILAEEAAFGAARHRLGEKARLFYRRRRNNTAKKAGNVADFCRRWGGAYDYLLVLDADSLMDAKTIVALARRMEDDPDAGLIQTVPRLVNGKTLIARLQQFAGRFYGPVIAAGLAWWTDREGNFWGHNAIIRAKAFLSAAGLPELPGRPPLGGPILSHDFVEAALIRRAGWTVTIAYDLAGSYEEGPPSLVDLAIRDRRWCQGNMQHAKVIGARGLHFVSRLHLLTGMMSYLASPLWLLLILAGLALSLQAHFIRPEYFKDEFQLFPSWPRIDPDRALLLFTLTMGVLFGPKILGLFAALTDKDIHSGILGRIRLVVSFLFEAALSALLAPIMMLMQTGALFEIAMRRDSGWRPQRRDDGALPFRALLLRHRWHTLGGCALALTAYVDDLTLLAWLAPAVAGLLLSAPLSAMTASTLLGRLTYRLGLLRTPEEENPPSILSETAALQAVYAVAVRERKSLAEIIKDPLARAQHLALVDPLPPRARGAVDPIAAVVTAKIGEAETLEEALSFLEPREKATLIATPRLVEALARLPGENEITVHGVAAE